MIKLKLWCRLFGHEFIRREIEMRSGVPYKVEYASDYCRHCGLSKQELMEASK